MGDDADVLELNPGESPRQKIARANLAMVDCSATVDQPRYIRFIVRPSDRVEPKLSQYYLKNARLSTCQLKQEAVLRVVGGDFPEVVAPFATDGSISAKQTALWSKFGAFEIMKPGDELVLDQGDGWWIDDGSGLDVHAGDCVEDSVRLDEWTIQVVTVEGGQWKVNEANPQERAVGTTAQRKFTRTFKYDPLSRVWKLGSRHVIRVLRTWKIPFPVIGEAAPEFTGPTEPDGGAVS